jgi:PQQ-dependent catabolism-associated CXXCW motif protein
MKSSKAKASYYAAAVFLTSCLGAVAQTIAPPEPAGYRLDDYRSKTPNTLAGASVIDTRRAFELWTQKQAVFIDTLPHAPKPANLPKDAVWRDKPHFDIPGSIWLPDTGYGELAPQTLRYFEQGLADATANDKKKAVVLYCLADCWMSWNAAKRALSLGYANIFWYPEGMDGWAAAGHPQEERQPEPRD